MPYCLKLISQPKAENKEVSVFLDKFIWYDRKKNILYYKNRNAIDIQLYKDKQREIIHFLGLHNKSIELDIQPFKSNLLNLLLYSIFWNYNDIHNSNIDYTILIDLKGNELSLYNYKNTRFIDNIEGVADIFKELKELMSNRYNQMKEKGDKTFKGLPIIVVIDEVGTIGTHYDKKLRDAIFNDMIELFQKSRACKIIFMIFAQKCDSTNIQSRVLMKTDSDFNTNAMI